MARHRFLVPGIGVRIPAPQLSVQSGYAAYKQQRYFPSLDGVRAVAVILVFIAHVGYRKVWGSVGGDGVTMFFVLSGFLITTLALREEERTGRLSLSSFYIRRFFRIYPVYFAILALYCVLIFWLGFVPERRNLFEDQLPYYVLGFPEHHFFDITGGIESGPPYAGAWSIGIEEKFYLVWPLVGFVLLRGIFKARLVVCFAGAVVFALAPVVVNFGNYLFSYEFITLGVIIALLLHHPYWFERLAPLGKPPVVLGLFCLLFAFWVVLPDAGDDVNAPLKLIEGVVITLAMVGVVLSNGRETGFLRSGPMVLLGRISYVFYLTHNFALNLVEKTPLGNDGILWSIGDVLVAFPLAVFIAWVIHVTLEKPLVRVGHKLARRDKPFHAV
jgi:peptidoglycan/LPS O-acetylase OafA/YrhL